MVSPSSEPRAQLHRALQVLARLLGVADAAEHAAEDPVRAAGRARLAEPLGQAQRLLRRVDGEHVVAGVEVEPGGLLVEPHELEPRRAVLEQVDALLVVLDGRLALALVRERGADLAVQVGHALEVLLAAVPVEALLPDARSPRPRGRAAATRRPASRRCARASARSSSRADRRARGGSGPPPRGSSRGAPRRRPPPRGSARARRPHRRELVAARARPRGPAPPRGRSARPAAPPPRRFGRRRAPR